MKEYVGIVVRPAEWIPLAEAKKVTSLIVRCGWSAKWELVLSR
jgi:hypothetical protein